MHLRARLTFTSRFKLTENQHPKPDKRAMSRHPSFKNGDTEAREGAGAKRLAYVHYRTAGSDAHTRPNRAYQNYRKMVEICTLLPTLFTECRVGIAQERKNFP